MAARAHHAEGWQMLAALTDLLHHVFCDTMLIDHSLIDHPRLWGLADEGDGLFAALKVVMDYMLQDWWPRQTPASRWGRRSITTGWKAGVSRCRCPPPRPSG